MLSVNSHCISSILLIPQNYFSSRSLSLLRLSLSSRASVLPIPPILSLLRLAISIPFSRLISLFHFHLPCILFLSLKFAFLRLVLSRALFSLPYLYFLSPLLRSIPLSLYLRFRFLVSSSHFFDFVCSPQSFTFPLILSPFLSISPEISSSAVLSRSRRLSLSLSVSSDSSLLSSRLPFSNFFSVFRFPFRSLPSSHVLSLSFLSLSTFFPVTARYPLLFLSHPFSLSVSCFQSLFFYT